MLVLSYFEADPKRMLRMLRYSASGSVPRAVVSFGLPMRSFPGARWQCDESVIARAVSRLSQQIAVRLAAAGPGTPWYRT